MDEDTEARAAGEDRHLTTPSGLAFKALLEHTQGCEQCTDDPTECGTGRALVRTVREARRVESAATARVRDVHG
ncbi:hypothetical protein [Streptomyces sp. NPDC051554]|uniref:hypothetical protein n=1 Tax=Streptomyces sp. NPDC051554 TaxID=3365656 RepID=UPI0037A9EABB